MKYYFTSFILLIGLDFVIFSGPLLLKRMLSIKGNFFSFFMKWKGRENNFYIWHLLRWTNWIITILFLYHMSKHTKTIFFIYFIVLQLSTRSKLITINVKRFSSGWPLRVQHVCKSIQWTPSWLYFGWLVYYWSVVHYGCVKFWFYNPTFLRHYINIYNPLHII